MADDPEDPRPGLEAIDEALDSREAVAASFAGDGGSDLGQPSGQAAANGDLNARLAKKLRNDLGNGERLIARHGEDLMHVRDVGWHAWWSSHWSSAEGPDEARRRAHKTTRAMFDEAETLDDDKTANKHAHHAGQSGASAAITNMLKEAAPYLGRSVAGLDANPYLFNVQNGTLVLVGSCETLKPHQRRDRITRLAPVTFKPGAPDKEFRKFLNRVLPDPDLRTFLQTWFGYCLTGLTSEQVLVFCHGRGMNGKSVLLNVVSRVMGGYATTLPFQSLLYNEYKGGGDASPDLARLPGARFVTAVEPETGSRFSESTIKSLTGGDMLLVRHLRQDFFEFDPVFKLTLSGNNRPTIRGQDEGIWRRFLLVPFEVLLPEEERVRDLDDRLFDAEAAGVLNWLLDGCRLWLDGGLKVPDKVRAETKLYRAESDSLGEFMAERVEEREGATIQAKVIYGAYEEWCKSNGVEPMTRTLFGRKLVERGVKKDKQGVIVYLGIELLPAPDAYAEGPGGEFGDIGRGDGMS